MHTECFLEKSSFSISLQLLSASESFSLLLASCGVSAEWCDAPAATLGDIPPILNPSSPVLLVCREKHSVIFLKQIYFETFLNCNLMRTYLFLSSTFSSGRYFSWFRSSLLVYSRRRVATFERASHRRSRVRFSFNTFLYLNNNEELELV